MLLPGHSLFWQTIVWASTKSLLNTNTKPFLVLSKAVGILFRPESSFFDKPAQKMVIASVNFQCESKHSNLWKTGLNGHTETRVLEFISTGGVSMLNTSAT